MPPAKVSASQEPMPWRLCLLFKFFFFLMSNLEGNNSFLLKFPGYVNAGGVTQVAQ